MSPCPTYSFFFFFFNDPATTEIYTLSLHDALPIFVQGADHRPVARMAKRVQPEDFARRQARGLRGDRKSTRLNSSHPSISYAVFCLKKKNTKIISTAYATAPFRLTSL